MKDGAKLSRKPTPDFWVQFHFVMMFVWAVLLVPSLLWWKTSILWVIIVSLYANFVTHFSAWHASKAEREAGNNGRNR